MGNVKALPLASPSIMTSAKALFMMSISGWKSEYVSSRSVPPMITGWSVRMVDT